MGNIAKKFYEYNRGLVNEVNQALTVFKPEYHKCFLIYAEDEKQAFRLAMQHIYDGLPTVTLSDVAYKNKYYDIVKNVVAVTGTDGASVIQGK